MALTKGEVTKNYFLDYFHLPQDYPDRIAKYPDTQLKKSEAIKTRTCYSCMCSIASGSAFVVPTHGGSAVICVWAARRWYVAARKLKYIKAELTKRKIALRPFLHRDWLIPASIAVVAASIGLGVDLGLGFFVPIGHAGEGGAISPSDPSHLHPLQRALADGVTHATDPNLADPSPAFATLQGAAHTPIPTHEIAGVAHGNGVARQFMNGFEDQINAAFGSHHPIEGNTLDATYQSAAAWVAGADSAQIMERKLAVLLGQQTLSMICERLDTESLIPISLRSLSCPRHPWATDNMCSSCAEPIRSGRFFHCCKCKIDDEELTLCLKCQDKVPDSHDDDHDLLEMQTALPGRIFLPTDAIHHMKSIAGPKSLSCNACGFKITRGWHYNCWDCQQSGQTWTECAKCYKTGRTCLGDASHSLYAFRRASFAPYREHTPYQHRGSAETGQAKCSVCHGLVSKGAYYHCSKCDNGNFDLCEHCFATDEHCHDNEHTLRKYCAWKYKRPVDRAGKKEWKCDNLHSQFRERDDAFFFSCREKDCGEGGGFRFCPPCYFQGFMCPTKEHEMFKCIWR